MNTSFLYRLAGAAGMACAALLAFNTARRAGLLPENGLTHAIAPFGALAGLFALTGLYLWQRDQVGAFGLLGYALNAIGLAGAFAIEYTVHFVFPYLPKDIITRLLDGGTGTAFIVTAVVLILGVLAFGAASWRGGLLPVAALALYVVGMIPTALRTAVPLPAYLLGLVVTAVGIGWLSLAMYAAATRVARLPAAA